MKIRLDGTESMATAAAATSAVIVPPASTAASAMLLLSVGGEIDAKAECDGGIGFTENGEHLVGGLFPALEKRILLDLDLELLEATEIRVVGIAVFGGLKLADDFAVLAEKGIERLVGFELAVDFVEGFPLVGEFDGVGQLRAGAFDGQEFWHRR